MRIHCLVVVLLCSAANVAQNIKIQTLKQTNPLSKDVYTFPKVVITNAPIAALKINNALREDILSAPANAKDVNIFDNVWATKSRSFPTINNISFETIELSASIICLAISAEGCGAYCEGFTHYFVFNSKTGNKLTLDSLFTKEGVAYLLKKIDLNKELTINEKLKELKDSLDTPAQKDKEHFSSMKDMYTECLNLKVEGSSVKNIQYTLKAGSLTIITERCSAHVNMALDELWEFKLVIDLRSQAHYLSKYGVSLLNRLGNP